MLFVSFIEDFNQKEGCAETKARIFSCIPCFTKKAYSMLFGSFIEDFNISLLKYLILISLPY